MRRAETGNLLVLVEDTHWLDGETLAVLEALVNRLTAARVLPAVTYRPEFEPGWGNRAGADIVRLDPLGDDDAIPLAARLLGGHPSVRPLGERLATWTAGIPLFLVEAVRSLAETGTLRGVPGGYALAQEVGELLLPPRVQGVLAARIDRLAPEPKGLLQAAAVIGAQGPVDLLGDVLDLTDDELDEMTPPNPAARLARS